MDALMFVLTLNINGKLFLYSYNLRLLFQIIKIYQAMVCLLIIIATVDAILADIIAVVIIIDIGNIK